MPEPSPKSTPRLAVVAITGLLAALAGCVDVLPGRDVPDTRFYSLDPALPERPTADSQPVAIRVERPSADPTARRLEIVLRKRPPSQEVVPFLYHRWVAMPDVFVGERLREHLAATGLFERVLADGDRSSADFRLDSRLTRLEGVETESGVEAVIVLEITLTVTGGAGLAGDGEGDEEKEAEPNSEGERNPEILRHRIEKRAPAESTAPAAIADALSSALRELLADVARRVDFAIRSVRS